MAPHRASPWKVGPVLLALCLAGPLLGLARASIDTKSPKAPPIPAAFTKAVPESVEDLKAIQAHVRALSARVLACTVNVRIGMGQGSGVIISADGYVLTAGHVSGTPGRDVILTLASGRKVKGKTLGVNRGIDSGLIKITEEGKWPHCEMGKSADLKRGDWCLAVGHPTGYKEGRSPVVRLGRVLDHGKVLIRSDCALVGGDSGGPLFDMQGRVIGIHSRIAGPLTANIHVPVDTYRDTWDKLAKGEAWGGGMFGFPAKGEPYLGVKGDPEAEGCKITEVVPNSPAAKAGLQVDDVVLRFAGQKINDFESLRARVLRSKPGQRVTLEIQRGEKTRNIEVVVGKRSD
jgi:serine protease Do